MQKYDGPGTGARLSRAHVISDPALTLFRTIGLYQQLADNAGGYGKLQRSVRLFMVPGMQHCIGGPGPNVFDTLTPLEAWVEQNAAPASIPAAHYANDDPTKPVERTMPLCPYPTFVKMRSIRAHRLSSMSRNLKDF